MASPPGKKDPKLPAVGSADADKFLFERGTSALEKKNWLDAREYFKKLVDTYPQSTYRQDAKLGIGDSYLGEKRDRVAILAVNEFREFLQYFPLNPKADYAQYRICAAEAKQMLIAAARPDRHARRPARVRHVPAEHTRTASTAPRSRSCAGRRAIGCPSRSSRSA